MRSFPPAALLFAPGGHLSKTERRSIIEIKTGASCIVFQPEPGAVLLNGSAKTPLADHHITIHEDSMVHAKGASSTHRIRDASIVDGKLADDAVALVPIASAPCGTAAAYKGRFQSTWQGGVPILPFAVDEHFDPARTRLVVDIWATRTDFEAPAFLPRRWPGARAALTYSGQCAHGAEAAWAFKDNAPPCRFFFRYWYTEELDGDHAIIATPVVSGFGIGRTDEQQLSPATPPAVEQAAYEIRGFPAHVTFRIDRHVFRLSPEEAEQLAAAIEKQPGVEHQGLLVVPIELPNATLAMAVEEAAKAVGFLRSAAQFARGDARARAAE